MASISPPQEEASASYHHRNGKRNPSSNGVESVSDSVKRIKPSSSFITSSEIVTEFSHHDQDFARINNGSFGCSQNLRIQSRYQASHQRRARRRGLNRR
ncbi:unnamed protein product [Cochlearia groenlandica]